MHPLVPPALAFLCVDASPHSYHAAPVFLGLALASVLWKAVGNLLLLGLFGAHLSDTVSRLGTGTAPAIVFAASAPLSAALKESDLALLGNALWAVRAVSLVGGVIETLFARHRLLVTANNVVTMALAAYTPAEVVVTYLVLTTVLPGTLVLSVGNRGATVTAGRLLLLWAVFEGLAGHAYGYELCVSMAVAISL